jgi:hypothetical protein
MGEAFLLRWLDQVALIRLVSPVFDLLGSASPILSFNKVKKVIIRKRI